MKGKILCILFLLNLTQLQSNEVTNTDSYKPHILIKIPTRGRPEQFFGILDAYYQNISGKYPYLFLISCDNDDQLMNNAKVIQKLKSYPHLEYRFGDNTSKIEAYNADIDEFKNWFDIVIATSDDMEPVVANYDVTIVNEMLRYFPDFSGVLNFFNGVNFMEVNTYPILGKNYYLTFGYVYHPDYKSFFCDDELRDVSRLLGKEKLYRRWMLFRHKFMAYGNDAVYARAAQLGCKDQILYKSRKRENFYLKDLDLSLLNLSRK